jgi:hypothetical protein
MAVENRSEIDQAYEDIEGEVPARVARTIKWAQPQQSCHEGPFGQIEGLVLGSMAACKNRELCTKLN